MDLSKHIDAGGSRNNFLRAGDVGKGGQYVILNVREAPREMKFSDVVLALKDGAKVYDWGLSFKSVNLRTLAEKLGNNTDKWTGKKVKLVTVDWFNNRTRKKMKIINVA